MEKKATRRLIGVLVVIALVIILLPLMFNSSDNQSTLQASEIKSPPFPTANTVQTAQAQPANVNNINNPVVAENHQAANNNFVDGNNGSIVPQQSLEPVSDTNLNPSLTKASSIGTGDAEENIVVIDSENDAQPTQPQTLSKSEVLADLNKSPTLNNPPVATATAPTPSVPAATSAAGTPTPTIAEAQTTPTPAPIKHAVQEIKRPTVVAHVKAKPIAPVKKLALKKSVKPATTETGAMKKAGWMVQLGSFKNKMNAERLTNTLRAKGYKAFTIQGKGSAVTRVCVGPETQQNKASVLADKIAQDINMHGIVMSYKPMEL